MQELNLSTFIQIMRPGLMAHDGQESAGTFLLNSINNQEYTADHGCYTNLDSKKISRLVSRQDPVPDDIKQASLDSGVIRKTIEYFETEVIADMNPHLKDDTLEQLAVVVKSDASVSTQKREYLLGLYKTSQYGRFLGEAFLYVVNRDNRRKKGADTIDYDDIPLLDEVNYECPLTHIKLVETVKGQPVKRYVITQIFPEGLSDELESAFIQVYDRPMDLNAPDNLIALSEQRSADYLISPTVEEYKALYDLKRRLEAAKKAANAIAATQLEDDIHTIINALITIADDEELIALEYDALHIEEKIQDRLLRPEIQFLAVRYSPIKYVAKFQPACDTSNFDDDTDITYTPMDCIKNGYYVPNTAKYGSVAPSLTPYEEGDIVMAKVTPCFENGNIAIMENLASGFGMGSSELFVYRATGINVRFLLYWLQNDKFKDNGCATMTGTGGLKRVSPYYAKNAMVLLPPDDEQAEIVAYLDRKCTEMDRLIIAKEKLLTELEFYKKSVIYEYVTGKKEVPTCQ